MLLARELTERIIGLAIEVHRLTGPGMLESVYEGCFCHELQQAESPSNGLGLLFSFHARLLKDGLRRFVV